MAMEATSPNEALDTVDTVSEALPDGLANAEEAEAALTGGGDADAATSEETADVIEAQVSEGVSDEEQAAPEKPEEPKSRAQERIRALVEEKNTLAEALQRQATEQSRQFQVLQQRYEQQLESMRYAQEQSAHVAQEQLRLQQEREQAERYQRMSVREQLEHDAAKRARGETSSELDAMRREFREELQRRDQQVQAAQEQWKRKERLARLESEASEALSGVLFKDLDQSDVGSVKEDFMDMFLAYAGGKGAYPKDAAPKFRQVMERVALAINKSKAKASKAKVQNGQNVPSLSGGANPGAKSPAANGVKSKKPTWDELQKAGFDNYVDYYAQRAMRGE